MMLNRNDRTIWTVYRRAKLKRSGLTRKSRSKSRSADRKSVVKDGKTIDNKKKLIDNKND